MTMLKNVDNYVNKRPRTFKELNMFLILKLAPTCFIKQNGNIYKLLPDTTFVFVCRNLDQLTFGEYLNLSLNNNFKTT